MSSVWNNPTTNSAQKKYEAFVLEHGYAPGEKPEYIPHTIYRQQMISVIYGGIPIHGFSENEALRIEYIETDPSCKSMRIEIDLRESSVSHEYLFCRHRMQNAGSEGLCLIVITGTDRVVICHNAKVSLPPPLATGGKKMGKQTYTFTSENARFY